MDTIFSEKGQKKLDALIKKGTLCAFDFDGTLAPIVNRHQNAYLPPPIAKQLATLASLTPVAILTGRAIKDIRPRLPFTPHYLIGNHGLEGIPGWEKHEQHYRHLCAQWHHAIQNALSTSPENHNHIEIENKQLSLSIHYRHAANPAQTGKTLLALLKENAPDAFIMPGKYLYNLVPPDAPDKGAALNEIMKTSKAPAVLYVGDDITDENIFRLSWNNLLSIRVEKDLASAAPWYIPTHQDITKLLDHLINRIQSQNGLP